MPTWDKLMRQDESMPFRMPVDPIVLGIPDYFEIVKRPMDLTTIKNSLNSGKYSDPWEYVDDVWLMFENAWLYNRKTSRVYRYCTKVREGGRVANSSVLLFRLRLHFSWRRCLSKKSIL